jgi:hypothetical protein
MGWATFWAIFFTNSSGHPKKDTLLTQNAAIYADEMIIILAQGNFKTLSLKIG